jgi:membrane-bound lytic murein transglycosylase D
MIERILAEEGLPQELIFLAQAESGFVPRAISRAKCVGLWQFKNTTGHLYGLFQSVATDDRMDPEKATRAAARHLHDLYAHFGDWYLAMAAYNCGAGCVDHAVLRTGYADFWALRRSGVLPKETANYVPAILAMTIMSKNAKDYELENIDFDPTLEYETVELPTPTHLGLVAAAVDRPVSELLEINPALKKSVAPAGYALHVPKGTLANLEAALAVVPLNRRDSWRIHRVEEGDTFTALAKRYGVTASQISSANHDELPLAGSVAAIPVSAPAERAAPARKPAKVTTGKTAVRKTSSKASTRKATPRKTNSAAINPAKKTAKKPLARSGGKAPARRPAAGA